MLERNKKPVYYCERYIENDMELFKPPVKRRLNFKSVNGETTLMTGGEVNTKNLVAKALSAEPPYREKGKCYINKVPPAEHDPFCNDADYVVKSVLPNHSVTEIIFERLVGG